MVVYKATNKINGLVYIGCTTKTLEERKRCHLHGSDDFIFQRALRKYGDINFTWEILYLCNNVEELGNKERYYINEYHSYDRKYGYNLTFGGILNGGHIDEVKEKISEKVREWNNTEEGKTYLKSKSEKFKTMFIGNGNPNAKKHILISPEGEKYEIYGNLKSFCEEKKISLQVLRKNINRVVPKSKYTSIKIKYPNTVGWCLCCENKTTIEKKEKMFVLVSPQGVLYQDTNLKKLCFRFGIEDYNVSSIFNGSQSTTKNGWTAFRYEVEI
jgi:group I intron endonuclease